MDAARLAAWDAADVAARAAVMGEAADAAWAASSALTSDAAMDAARLAAWDAADVALWNAAWDAADVALWNALRPVVEELQESAFDLLDRMIDPGGIHDVKTESEWLESVSLLRGEQS
jgi:hypothetical protein